MTDLKDGARVRTYPSWWPHMDFPMGLHAGDKVRIVRTKARHNQTHCAGRIGVLHSMTGNTMLVLLGEDSCVGCAEVEAVPDVE
jgi:hypothetical protein